jgi:hypothetical protein
MKDAGYLTYYEFSPVRLNVEFTELGKSRLKALYAIINRDYLAAGAASVNARDSAIMLQKIGGEVFKSQGQNAEFALIEGLATYFAPMF